MESNEGEVPNVAKRLLGRAAEGKPTCRGLRHPKLDLLPPRRRIFAVVHVKNPDQAVQNSVVAREAGCDGVFLIGHGIGTPVLLDAFRAVRERDPELFVGLNVLSAFVRVAPFLCVQLANLSCFQTPAHVFDRAAVFRWSRLQIPAQGVAAKNSISCGPA